MTQKADQDVLYQQAAGHFGPALQRLARATEANPERRRDLLQEMHVALWKSFALFDGRCQLSTWVYRVAHNTAARHVGRERRYHAGRVALEDISGLSDGGNLAGAMEQNDALERLNAWIRRLKTPDREILSLYLENLPAAEIAEITGLSSGAVATRISRLKAQLTKDFQEQTHA
jgi:RNA polymerase sigma-70 factor (ECF subfamily)